MFSEPTSYTRFWPQSWRHKLNSVEETYTDTAQSSDGGSPRSQRNQQRPQAWTVQSWRLIGLLRAVRRVSGVIDLLKEKGFVIHKVGPLR